MVIFTLGNAACALAPSYSFLMAARILTALAHGAFFGVGSVVATRLVTPDRKASAIAIMFTGVTVANILGVPFGTWLGQQLGWRATFWAVAAIGLVALTVIARLVPQDEGAPDASDWRQDVKAMARCPVLLGLLTTVLGYAGDVETERVFPQTLGVGGRLDVHGTDLHDGPGREPLSRPQDSSRRPPLDSHSSWRRASGQRWLARARTPRIGERKLR